MGDAGGQIAERKTAVFISYSRKDTAFVERLRLGLEERGYDVLLDKHDIVPGEPWRDRLSEIIAQADTVVLCLSPSFLEVFLQGSDTRGVVLAPGEQSAVDELQRA